MSDPLNKRSKSNVIYASFQVILFNIKNRASSRLVLVNNAAKNRTMIKFISKHLFCIQYHKQVTTIVKKSVEKCTNISFLKYFLRKNYTFLQKIF